MKRTRMALPIRDLEELRLIAYRLDAYSEEWDDLGRTETEAKLAGFLSKLPSEKLQRMLGFRCIRELHRLSQVWEKTEYGFRVDRIHGMVHGLHVLMALVQMGLAVMTESEYRVDSLARRAMAPLSEDLEEELKSGDAMQIAVDEILERFGMVGLDTVMDILISREEDLEQVDLAAAVRNTMLLRHGRASVKEWKGMTLLLDERVVMNPDFLRYLESSLYCKLPYRYGPDFGCIQDDIIDLITGEAAYPFYALLTPSKEMPMDPSELKGNVHSVCHRRIRRSPKTHTLSSHLSRAAYMMLLGERIHAERLLLHDGSRLKSPEERKELKEIVTEFLDDCPQWALKGWSIEEVREAQRMSDRQYLNVVDLLDPIPGEDDLCPCGSGKLFRKCHGRGN